MSTAKRRCVAVNDDTRLNQILQGFEMGKSITNNSTLYPQNSFAASDKKLEAGSFVVNPPEKFYRFSVYDELNLDRDIHSEFLQKLDPKAYKQMKTAKKTKKIFSQILTLGVAVSGAILAYKNRCFIKNTATNAFNAIKNFFKK